MTQNKKTENALLRISRMEEYMDAVEDALRQGISVEKRKGR